MVPPEAELLRARRGDMSIREAARRARISDGTWRRLERDPGRPPAPLARAASVLGVTPAELAAVGRADAARSLERLMEHAAARPEMATVLDGAGEGWPRLMAVILAGFADIDGTPGLSERQRAGLRAELMERLARDTEEWRRTLRAIAGNGAQ